MDYDDNDFQCQNIQLVGEDSNRFPPSLRSFPLPKFDLDEHLQLHLRFDSLVETEVLLGIQGQGNNWIEDFTPVGSEIEFNSSAAESCSISRHKNVWSEATSSESVEMLLKSVGEDEMIDQKATIKEADVDDGLNGMDGQMNTCLRQNDPHKTADIIHTDPVLPPDKCQKGSSLIDEDANRDQLQVEGTPEPSENEKSGTDMDVSSLSEKFKSEGIIVANQCSVDKKLNLSSYAIKSSSVIDEAICEAVQNDNLSHNAFVRKCATEGPIASSVSDENSDFNTFKSIQDDRSSLSTSNHVLSPGKTNTQMLTDQVMEQYNEIDISGSEKSGLLADDAQKESSQIRDCKVNDQPFQGSAVRSGLSSAEGSSILEPTMESLALLNEECNEPEFSENPDGLLHAITYQVKALNKESQAVKIALPTNESYSLVMGDRNIENNSVEICKEDIAEPSHVTEGCRSAGYSGREHLPEDDATHVESTLSTENTNRVDSYEGRELNILVDVIEEKQDPDIQLTDNNNSDYGNTSEFIVKVHSLSDTSYEISRKETNNDYVLGVNPLNFTSENPNSTVIAKYVDDIAIEDTVKGAEVKFNAPKDDRLEESPSPALPDDADKLSSSTKLGSATFTSKSLDKCDTDELVAEPDDVRTFPPVVAAFVKENTAPSMNSGSASSNDDASIVRENIEDASSAGQKTAISTVKDCSSAKKLFQDESVIDLASVDVNLHSPNNPSNVHESQPEDTLPMDVAVKQNDATCLSASDFIHPDEKELEICGSTNLKSNLDSQISREPVEVSDPLVVDGSSAKDMTQDEPVFELVSADNSLKFHQSESEDTMVVDVVVDQKVEATSSSPVTDFIHSNEKEVKISGVSSLSISKGIANAEISSGLAALSDSGNDSLLVSPTELQAIVVGQSSSAEGSDVGCQNEIGHSSAGGSDVGCRNELHSSIDNPVVHEHAMRLEGNLVAHAASAKGNDNFDSSGTISQEEETAMLASVETANHDEKQSTPTPLSLEKSSSADIQKKQESSDANLGPGDDCYGQNDITQMEGDSVDRCTNSSPESVILTRSNAESLTLEAESGNTSAFQQDCSSPTVISCSEHSHEEMDREGNRGLPDPTGPVSDDPLLVSSEIRVNGDKVKSHTHDLKESSASEDDRSFTFEVGSLADLSERDTGNDWKPFSNMQSFELPKSNLKMSKENSQECHLESERVPHGTITKVPYEDNTRGVSACSTTERITISPGDVSEEAPIPKQSAERDGNPCTSSPKSVGTVNMNVQLEEMQHYPYTDRNIKASCSPTVHTSSLPDLNTSISVAALYYQPFTDLQQVQLRAQIFVYGSLIQGIPPDEACMISAFGETDGGRSLWEGVWRVSAERYQNQKSPFSSCETPSHSHSGIQVSEQVTRCSSLQGKSPSTPSRSSSKVVSSAIINSTVPLPSPLWSVSDHDGLHSHMPRVTNLDFNQALSPLHSHQTSQIRQYTGNSAPWLSQTPHPGPWVVSSQNSTLDATQQYSAPPVAETVQVTSVRDSSIPRALNMQLVSPTALLTTPGTTSVSTTPGNNKSASTIQKSRKRRKGTSVPEELQPNILVSQPVAEPASASGVTKHSAAPTSLGLPVSANSPTKVSSGGLVSATSHIISPTHYQIISRDDTEKRVIFSEETCSKIEQAMLQAEDAAALAASAVRHSQGIWTQLATHKNSGLVSDVDEKLASAAVAATAAASVAKAAAAAAKVASDAALQAKMMADETLNSVRTGNLTQISETDLLDMGKSLAGLTPVSILKGKDKFHGSSSIISAAREAARRRVEAASAATKRAENLDAIVRAAELAAEAVFQAGTIIAMGEPLPFTLSELVEAGPEGHWKVHRSTTVNLAKTNNLHQGVHVGLDGVDNRDKSVEEFNEHPLNNKEMQKNTEEAGMVSCNEHSVQSEEHYKGNASSIVQTDGHEKDHSSSNSKENSIQKGSLVEVIVDEDGLRGVWFSAHILDVKDGKANVCYNNLVSDEGTGPLKEWISLEGEGNKAPRIRLAHPITTAKYEGTRKRRREAIGNYVWAIGDRVDAWIRDGWWEGIVSEKSQGDDTKLTVHFPDGGDSSIVRAWNLRPSLVWKDGHWIEWSRARENALQSYEGDTPQEKRQKLGRPEARVDSEVDGRGISKLSKNLPVEDPRKPEELRPLILSAKDKIFSVGKNAREENNSDALKVKRTGLQKEGSRVVFGVPKPGKKRKFMEVSKHYVADKMDKSNEGNDSIKFAKYLMPQASRTWKNTSKVDPKGKSMSDSKPKGLKSVKSRSIRTRSTAEKDNLSITTSSNGGETGHGSLPNARAALSNEQNNLEKKSRPEVGSYANSLGITESPHVEPSGQPVPGVPSSKKKSSSAVEADSGVKGKLTPAVDKSTRRGEGYENTGRTMSDAPEPRRSSRRMQPTSRLLEGLQSSLIISKIPSFSHDKGTKAQHRGASSRGNAHG